MKPTRPDHFGYMLVCFAVVLLASCATHSYIDVKYQLPLSSYELKGKAVSLDFRDLRPEKIFLSPAAQKDFKYFSGLFSLYISSETQKNELVGGYNVEMLFKESFKRRLEAMGVKVLPAPDKSESVIEIGLKEFYLDYKSRKWITSVSYQARLVTPEGHSATESVSITGERAKIIGKGDAEKYLGVIFTDSLNKLDIDKLFQQAGL